MRILHSKKMIFVSKPRCGSTSIRRLLDEYMEPGDIACDIANQIPELHPHMSAPAIIDYLERHSICSSEYSSFTVTRHPVHMLWSYFKFFQPDRNNNYNYNSEHCANDPFSFEEWIMASKVGIGRSWASFVPNSVSDKNLSPLSLEAHVCDPQSKIVVDKIFKIESQIELVGWVSEILGNDLAIKQLNSSFEGDLPHVGHDCLEQVRLMFPMESEMYGICI